MESNEKHAICQRHTWKQVIGFLLCIFFLLLVSGCGNSDKSAERESSAKEAKQVQETKTVTDKKPSEAKSPKKEVPKFVMPYFDWEAYDLGKTPQELDHYRGTWLDITGAGNVDAYDIKINDGSNGVRYYYLWKDGDASSEIYGFKNGIVAAVMEYVASDPLSVGEALLRYGFTTLKNYPKASIIKTNEEDFYVARWRIKNGYLAIMYMLPWGEQNYLYGKAWKILMAMDRNISYYFDDPKESKHDNVNAENTSTTGKMSTLDEAKIELKQYGDFGELTQTTFSRGGDGWVGTLADGNTIFLDRAERRVALVKPNIVQRITNMAAKGSGYDVVRAKFYIYNDTKGGDEANGQWQGDVHILPVQAEYQIENGRVMPGMIKSGNGAEPSVYENYLYEQKNVNMINMFLKTAPYLKEN